MASADVTTAWVGVLGTLAGAVVGAFVAWKSARLQVSAARQLARDAAARDLRQRRVASAQSYISNRLTMVVDARSEAERAWERNDLYNILQPALEPLPKQYHPVPSVQLFEVENNDLFNKLDAFNKADRLSVETFSAAWKQPHTAVRTGLSAAFDRVERAAVDALDAIDMFIVGPAVAD